MQNMISEYYRFSRPGTETPYENLPLRPNRCLNRLEAFRPGMQSIHHQLRIPP